MFQSIRDIELAVRKQKVKKKLVLAAAHDEHALIAVLAAAKAGYIDPVLVGNKKKIQKILDEQEYSSKSLEVINQDDVQLAVQESVRLVSTGYAQILMKGACNTAELLRGVLKKEGGLRTESLLSHFALFELNNYHKLLSVSDVAISIAPSLDEKMMILKNAVSFLRSIGTQKPKVAVIAAVEKVNDNMPATLDAASLVEMNRLGVISDCIVDGPLAFDNAISRESALLKGITGEVAGDADLLIMPQIESGNILYKALTILANARVAAVVLGAKAPIVLTSRADSSISKLNSIMLAAV